MEDEEKWYFNPIFKCFIYGFCIMGLFIVSYMIGASVVCSASNGVLTPNNLFNYECVGIKDLGICTHLGQKFKVNESYKEEYQSKVPQYLDYVEQQKQILVELNE